MYSSLLFTISLSLLSQLVTAQLKLNTTAISAHDGRSTFECWQLDEPFSYPAASQGSPEATVGLGDVSNITYTVFPPNLDIGFHNAPAKQWVVWIKGLARFTLPDDNTTVYIHPGESSVIYAADTSDVSSEGHGAEFLGNTESVFLQIPSKDSQIPAHSVLHSGPCKTTELSGLWGLWPNASSQT
ncbi:hypothetical protein F5Y05DRAFT_395871 [Hypoxylon sp. FL0543]|nr:hypothetical protein F5Y05DRAFT_395871 [Hypoxylon sp. FL0543]